MPALLPLESPDFGLVTINGVSLHPPAWQCTNSYLLTDPAPRRRNNRVRPWVAGVYGGAGFKDEWSVELEIAISGFWSPEGSLRGDPHAGAEANWRYLVDNIYDASDVTVSGDVQGRVPVTVTSALPGAYYMGYVQLDSFRREPTRYTACGYLEVNLPSGGLTLVGA